MRDRWHQHRGHGESDRERQPRDAGRRHVEALGGILDLGAKRIEHPKVDVDQGLGSERDDRDWNGKLDDRPGLGEGEPECLPPD